MDGVGVTAMLYSRSEILAAPGRWCAAVAAAMMVFLTVAAFSPELHEAVCHHRHDAGNDPVSLASPSDCVIAQFGAGEVLPGEALSAEAPEVFEMCAAAALDATAPAGSGAWRMPPSCGPPARPV